MFGFLLCRRKKAKAFTWKVLKMLQSRLLLLKHQKYAKARHIRMDIADYIRSNESTNALLRTEQLFLVENSISIYDLLLKFTDFIIRRFSPIRKHGELVNDDTSEAVSTLIYASVKCKDIPEMLTLSELVGQRYGQRYVTTAIQVLPGNLVNTEIKKKLSIYSVSEHVKCRMVDEIAKESGYRLEILRLEHKSENENKVFDVKEKKVMDLDKEERSKKESPQEVYKFILTDVKDERSKKETSMKDDYIEDVMKSRLLAEKAKKSGHRLEILRPEYKPEIENQVYEEEEKKVIDPDMDITSYEEPPHEVYKFSITNFEEEIMEDDYVEDVKCRTLDEIMKKSGHRLEISRRKYKPENEKQVYEEEEKKVIDPDVDIRSYEESPHEVYKFSLTDFEEEIMEDDYIEDVKCRMLDEITKKSGHRLEISRREYKPENEKQVYEEVEKKVIDPDVDMRSYEESPHKVYKFSLTDFEEEIMEDDYIDDVKCRLLDEIMKSGHRLEISSREYKPEIEKQVNEEKEKNVMNMDIRCADQSPYEVYKISLTDVEEERSKEDTSMEDDYIEDGQVGKDQRVFRFRKSSEEKRKPSSPLSTLMEFRNTESLTYYMRQTRTHQRRRRSSTSPHCRHCVEYNEFKVKKEEEEEEEEERQSLKTKNVHSKLHEYEKFLTQFKKKKEAENERRRLFPKGFEPTLPDYDEVITRFRALEAQEEERQRLAATKHIHPNLPDYDQIVTQFKALKEEEKQGQRIRTK
ncbi:predicted protein [Arabidopsis lyrata subsp. lyrata]|uniref:Predicted protein n=1 Tax=Arabidopsis lyrata subsp. lyrata TaxID=81972 RepID=D7KIL6_ARALL|nr:predicted protein [Arabidopsis lyrata subsp. lyrata]